MICSAVCRSFDIQRRADAGGDKEEHEPAEPRHRPHDVKGILYLETGEVFLLQHLLAQALFDVQAPREDGAHRQAGENPQQYAIRVASVRPAC